MKSIICDVCGKPIDHAAPSPFPMAASLPFKAEDGTAMSVSYTMSFVVPESRDICDADLRKAFLASVNAVDVAADKTNADKPKHK